MSQSVSKWHAKLTRYIAFTAGALAIAIIFALQMAITDSCKNIKSLGQLVFGFVTCLLMFGALAELYDTFLV
jgi:ABC-type proline/glycine betaine transport system permease subunit|tara:strand:+ start:521 stop:736 length:216 start_codon:yes stop_codon:yes gene_type:complete